MIHKLVEYAQSKGRNVIQGDIRHLVIEENAFDLIYTRHCIEHLDDPLLALERFKQAPSEIVLCDLRMPQMDGLQVLEEVKRLSPTSEFVMMTAYATVETAIQAIKTGAFDYLLKPFQLDELKLLVQRILKTRDLEQENQLFVILGLNHHDRM